MTLLTTVFAAVICTVIWYNNAPKSDINLGFLTLMYWGASFMWLADAIFEYAELGAAYLRLRRQICLTIFIWACLPWHSDFASGS